MKKRFLHRRLATAVTWVALSFALLTSAVFYFSELNRSNQKTTLMLNQLLDTVEITASIAAYVENESVAQDVLDGLIKNDIVHEVRIRNNTGMNMSETRDTQIKKYDPVIRQLISPFTAEVVGTLYVIPESNFSLQEARHSAFFAALSTSVVIAIITWFILLVVKRYLSKPLMEVSNTLHAINAGEKHRLDPLPNNADDELGQLVSDVNTLLNTLEENFNAESMLRHEIEKIEKKLRTIFETTSAGIFIIDNNEHLLTANSTLKKVLKLPEHISLDSQEQSFINNIFTNPDEFRDLMVKAKGNNKSAASDLQLSSAANQPEDWVHCLLSHHVDPNGLSTYEGVLYDISDRKQVEQQLQLEAEYDSLTGLLRRPPAERKLDELLCAEDRRKPKTFCLMVMDLDHFKFINDTYGHAAGDAVLVETAKRIHNCVRTEDLVARLGGDEFMIIITDCESKERVITIAKKLIEVIQQPIRINETTNGSVGSSIGIAICRNEGQTQKEIMERADAAMYEIKRMGRNGFAISTAPGSKLETYTNNQPIAVGE